MTSFFIVLNRGFLATKPAKEQITLMGNKRVQITINYEPITFYLI